MRCARRVCGSSLWLGVMAASTCVVLTVDVVIFVPWRIWPVTSAWCSWMINHRECSLWLVVMAASICVVLTVDVAILRRRGFTVTLMYATCCVRLATVLRYVGSIERYKSAYQMRFFLIYSKDSVEDASMDIEVQEQKFRQSLDQLIYSTTQLTSTLVSNVVESCHFL